MNYLVFWIVANIIPTAPEPQPDPYWPGRYIPHVTLEFSYKVERDTFVRFFGTRSQAERFMNGAPYDYVDEIWLDSTIIPESKSSMYYIQQGGRLIRGSWHLLTDTLLVPVDSAVLYTIPKE